MISLAWHLASVIGAHFCAATPNFRILETDIDSVPWRRAEEAPARELRRDAVA